MLRRAVQRLNEQPVGGQTVMLFILNANGVEIRKTAKKLLQNNAIIFD